MSREPRQELERLMSDVSEGRYCASWRKGIEYELWEEGTGGRSAAPFELLSPYPAGALEAYPVTTRMNKVSYEEPDCIEPIGATVTVS